MGRPEEDAIRVEHIYYGLGLLGLLMELRADATSGEREQRNSSLRSPQDLFSQQGQGTAGGMGVAAAWRRSNGGLYPAGILWK